ncbi:MarR family winged helix-turn-helix transcriptional regulator [Mucilaginibacter sp. McL0603]|uniref:MarR family winged helix-turn-helix transcriptional regulator n=1 Tax=Mucilaginibacter sp. McL0603 TaxID=3415670 RepID=UPI003CE93F67
MTQNNDLQLASNLRTVVARLTKKLRKTSVTGQMLSLTERSTISALYQHKQLLPSELASMEKITNQSMSQVLNHLLELGFITRTASETDKRKVIISLTEEGERILLQVRSERDEWLANAIKENFNDDEEALLRKLIAPLTRLVDFE